MGRLVDIQSRVMESRWRSIGQLAAEVGVTASSLRFYESEGLLAPDGRTASGYRLYGPRSENRLGFVQRAQSLDCCHLGDCALWLPGPDA